MTAGWAGVGAELVCVVGAMTKHRARHRRGGIAGISRSRYLGSAGGPWMAGHAACGMRMAEVLTFCLLVAMGRGPWAASGWVVP